MAFYPEWEVNSRAVGAGNVVFAWLCAGCSVWEGEEEEEEDGGSDFENVHLVLGYFDVWMQSYERDSIWIYMLMSDIRLGQNIHG